MIDSINEIYGINIQSMTPLRVGADVNAYVYKAVTNHGELFIKLRRHPSEHSTIDFLLNANIPLIISPIKTIKGETTHHANGYTMTIHPYIEGQNGFSKRLTKHQWILLGQALRQLHSLNAPLSHIRIENYSPQWRTKVQLLLGTLHDIKALDDVSQMLLDFINQHRETIKAIVDHAEALAASISKTLPRNVLCHGDIHAGNVIIANNDDIFIVDWDAPIMAPKERDLMFIGGGVGNVWNDKQELSYFYEGYGDAEINMPLLAYYRFERIVEDIAEYAQLLLYSLEGEDRLLSYQHFIDMFEPNGVVDIAFETGEKLND